jgi:O-antigen ligase
LGERLFVVYAFFLMCEATLRPTALSGAPSAAPSGGSLTDSVYLPIYVIAIALLALRPRQAMQVAGSHTLTLVLLGVVTASIYWSSAPEITIRRSIGIALTTTFGWYLISRYSLREVVLLVAVTIGLTALLSLAYGIVSPGLVVEWGGAWRGVYANKNALARIMVLGAMSFMLLGLDGIPRKTLVWVGVALTGGMVLLSHSKTGLVALLVLALIIKLSTVLRLRTPILVPVLIIGGLVMAGALVWLGDHANVAAAELGKDVTLTGRTDIWRVSASMIARRPWLGYGYGAFWTGWSGYSGDLWQAVGWDTPHSHNGFLDLTLDLGMVGLVTFVRGLTLALYRPAQRAGRERTLDGVGPLAILAFTLCYNVTESSLLRTNDIFWVLYIAAACHASMYAHIGSATKDAIPPPRVDDEGLTDHGAPAMLGQFGRLPER